MNGAPQGDIFEATVKPTADLEASTDVGSDMKVGHGPEACTGSCR